ncbi:NAD-dependent epimerase/dehydratase family protein [Sphingobium nicotianae]|uniref:NAD(P)-dependent oxidoreductase n=1 Tax=Sphingobium nicotianae TaxID=2782607 RepID=A0A9X1DD96_9SPHN|nr:NAD(P)-dependent oxidoreductase [Sphingobium nicotianae]MBT2187931.1 NAD(P)-dependent oxidoreductase [Sphingobium nicotianae]
MILVTGSAGHLGEALMRSFRAEGVPARGMDIKPSPYTDIVASITDRAALAEAMIGVGDVINSATLHKPHVVTHSHQMFVDTNISGTLALLEAAIAAGVRAFVQTSTTSTFGSAMTPAFGEPAAWVTEDVMPIPRNIYGSTKLAAEHLCEMVGRRGKLPVIVLRTSRFFPEEDDNAGRRSAFSRDNLQALELLHRRVDIADIVSAHRLALAKAPALGFGRFIVSATSPFTQADLPLLNRDARAVIERHYPQAESLFERAGWSFPPALDRVYVNARARDMLGWSPVHDFAHMLDCLAQGCDFRSDLARAVGSKGYHDEIFAEGPYPVD